MRDIQHLLKVEVEFEVADGFEPEIPFPVKKPKNKAQPRKHGRSNPRSQDGRGRDERPKQRAAQSSDRYDSRKNSERPAPANVKSGKRADSYKSQTQRDGERVERKQWRDDSSNVKSGKRADSHKSQSQRDGERVERKQWRDDSSSQKNSKRQKATRNDQSEWSGKPKHAAKKSSPGSSRGGFSPPKRKAVKRSVSAR